MSATPLAFFFFRFGVCVVYTHVRMRVWVHMCMQSPEGEYQVPDLLLSTSFPQEPCPVSSWT